MRKINELEEKLRSLRGKEKIEVLNELSARCAPGSPEKGLEYAREALELSKELKEENDEARSLNNIGGAYLYLSQYHNSLDFFYKSLNIYEKNKNQKGEADIFNNIGNVYYYLGNKKKALSYFHKALDTRKELNLRNQIADSLNNIGIIYDEIKEHKKALKYYLEALDIRNEFNDKAGTSSILNNIGLVYRTLEQNEKALYCFFKALKIFEENDDNNGVVSVLLNIEQIQENLGKYEDAIFYLKRGLEIAKEMDSKFLIQKVYNHFSRLYERKKDFEKALEYYKLYTEIKDQIFNKEMREKIAKFENQYEAEKKEKELAELKIRFINMASHEFRTPLTVICSVAEMFTMFYEDFTEEQRKEHIKRMKSATSYMTKLLDDILIVGKMYSGNLDIESKKINLKSFLDDIIQIFRSANKKNQELILVSEDLDFEILIDDMYLRGIILNLLSNAEKYSPERSQIKIETEIEEANKLCIFVEDEGIGILEEDKEHIFEAFHLGKNAYMNQGIGMGLAIVKRAVEKLEGTIDFEPKVDRGTRFKVVLPFKRPSKF